ncbi:MAG: hypothetical protein F6K42_04270 [Leptolyngbya sp. SIO1D8]|nr:hypothetical protein [Leptolyngbya sp. SIO1D8]
MNSQTLRVIFIEVGLMALKLSACKDVSLSKAKIFEISWWNLLNIHIGEFT